MNGNDEQLIWETYQQLYEAISGSEALSRMRGAIAAGHEDLIPDILDLVDVKDRPALAKKAKMFGISHPAFNAVIPPAGEGEEYPGTGDVEWFETDDRHFWQTIYHEMWWEHIERAVPNESHMAQGHKDALNKKKPDYVVTGPKMHVEFHEVGKVDLKTGEQTSTTIVMKEDRSREGYPDSYYIIHDYDLRSIKEWWEENWKFLENGPDEEEPGDKYHLNPPDEADSWRDEEDETPGSVDPEVVVDNLRQAIENLESAGDAKGYYWDAIELNVDQQRLDDMLDEYVESDHLSPEEREYIKQEDEPPPGTEQYFKKW